MLSLDPKHACHCSPFCLLVVYLILLKVHKCSFDNIPCSLKITISVPVFPKTPGGGVGAQLLNACVAVTEC